MSLISYYTSVPDLRASFGHHQVMSVERMVGRERGNKGGDGNEEHLCLFQNIISVDIYYTFPDYTPSSGNDYLVEGSIIKLTHHIVGVVTMLPFLKLWEDCGSHRQKVYADTFTSRMTKQVNQFIEQVCRFI